MSDFDARYYEWCRELACREAAAGFPSVIAVRGANAVRTAGALLGCAPPDRERLAAALVARWHRMQLDLEQQRLLAIFDGERYAGYPPERPAGRAGAARVTFKSLLRRNTDLLGLEVDSGGPSEMRFERVFAGYKVVTLADLGGRSRQLEYSQLVHLDGAPRPVQHSFHLMAFLGLSSATKWDLLLSGEEAGAVGLLRKWSERFMEAVPSLAGG